MATDSSSGTLPSSRRLTMDSSSSIARSNGRRLTSRWLLSAMMIPAVVARLYIYVCRTCRVGHKGVDGIAREDGRQRPDALRGLWCAPLQFRAWRSPLHQRGDVGGGGIREPVEVVAAFEHRYDTA